MNWVLLTGEIPRETQPLPTSEQTIIFQSAHSGKLKVCPLFALKNIPHAIITPLVKLKTDTNNIHAKAGYIWRV